MKLIIAEKPSVAMSIAKLIGAKNKKDGYYEGNDYRVSWCVGHLVQMANPDSYDEKYKKWRIEEHILNLYLDIEILQDIKKIIFMELF
ncbi:MAG: topoisomerase I [Peptoniphilus harei]|uniref:toprim domain-containing protein n=1 Tax=uncultured Peptoniphilus sp. TaxID=254354 RepID=UPI00258ADE32|nr:toprim domain-containing protein [uncultured Peptoniphilus sp.]MBS6611193.1 topoisomerase I [Peptoniphilus harei]